MTTLPDTNVRPARRAAAGSARAPGRSALARLLLFFLQHVSKLDRKLLLLLVASPMSACIIPAGPEFQDPIGVPNSPPFLVSSSPAVGMTVVDDYEFVVIAGDVNVEDLLYVKWITEYPPYNNDTHFLFIDPKQPSVNGSINRDASRFKPNCDQLNKLVSRHQIVAAISDRPFTDAGLLTTDSLYEPLLVNWTLQKTCPGALQ